MQETLIGRVLTGHLLINPWSRSAGLGGSAMASVRGAEACFLNVAGLAFTPKTVVWLLLQRPIWFFLTANTWWVPVYESTLSDLDKS